MMKKITLLTLFVIAPFFMFAQTWDFNGTDGGWTPSASTITTGTTFLTLTCNDGGSNPAFGQLNAGVTTANTPIAAVTLKINHANGPSFARISYPKVGGGRAYINLEITAGDTEFKTYYFDLSNATHWSPGVDPDFVTTMDDIKLHFKNTGNTTFVGTGVETIDIDKIEFIATIPTTEKSVYLFETDDDKEGWSELNGVIESVSGGILTFAPKADKFAKILQLMHYVDANANSTVHVTLQNLSTDDDQLRVIVGGGNVTIPITTSDASEKTYDIVLAGLTDWTGNVDGITLAFRDSNNVAGVGKSSGTGNFLIQSIIFDNNAPLTIISEAATDITCNGLTDGTITVTAFGGTSPYEYSIDGGTTYTANSGLFTGLSAGSFDISVNDANSDEKAGSTIIISEPLAISIDSVKITDLTSNGAADGTITVYASGGTDTLSYTLTPGDVSNITGLFEGLSANTYTVSVTDTKSCTIDSGDLVVTEPVSVEDINKNDANIILYPNPVKNVLTIKTSLTIEKLEVFNVSGQIVMSESISSKTFNMSDLSKGVYIVKIYQENDVVSTKRFIKD